MYSSCQFEPELYGIVENEPVTDAPDRFYWRFLQPHLPLEAGVEPLHRLVDRAIHHHPFFVAPGFVPEQLATDRIADAIVEHLEHTGLQWWQWRVQLLAFDADVVLFNIHTDVFRGVCLSYCASHGLHESKLLAADAAKSDNGIVLKLILHQRLNGRTVYGGAEGCPISASSDVYYRQLVTLAYDFGVNPGAVEEITLHNYTVRPGLTPYRYLTFADGCQPTGAQAVEVFQVCVAVRIKVTVVRSQLQPRHVSFSVLNKNHIQTSSPSPSEK